MGKALKVNRGGVESGTFTTTSAATSATIPGLAGKKNFILTALNSALAQSTVLYGYVIEVSCFEGAAQSYYCMSSVDAQHGVCSFDPATGTISAMYGGSKFKANVPYEWHTW